MPTARSRPGGCRIIAIFLQIKAFSKIQRSHIIFGNNAEMGKSAIRQPPKAWLSRIFSAAGEMTVIGKQAGLLLDRAEKAVLVWIILGLAVIGCIEVFTRYVLNYSFTWYEELGSYLGVLFCFLGAATGVRTGSHFTMDFFVTRARRPWQQLLKCGTALLSGVFFLLVAWYSWKIVGRMHGYGTTSPAMGLPMYLAYLPIPVFSVIMGLRYLAVGFKALRELGGAAEVREETR